MNLSILFLQISNYLDFFLLKIIVYLEGNNNG